MIKKNTTDNPEEALFKENEVIDRKKANGKITHSPNFEEESEGKIAEKIGTEKTIRDELIARIETAQANLLAKEPMARNKYPDAFNIPEKMSPSNMLMLLTRIETANKTEDGEDQNEPGLVGKAIETVANWIREKCWKPHHNNHSLDMAKTATTVSLKELGTLHPSTPISPEIALYLEKMKNDGAVNRIV